MLVNTAGPLPIRFRITGIGKGRVVMAIIIVDQSVPTITIRVWEMVVLRTKIMLANTAFYNFTVGGRLVIGNWMVVMAIIIAVQSVPSIILLMAHFGGNSIIIIICFSTTTRISPVSEPIFV